MNGKNFEQYDEGKQRMALMSNLRIGSRLALGFGLVLLGALALLVLGLWRMTELRAEAVALVDTKVVSLTSAIGMREASASLELALRKVATPTDRDEGERESQRATEILSRYAATEKVLAEVSSSTVSKTMQVQVALLKTPVLPPLLDIPDPRQAVLEEAVGRVWSSTVVEWEEAKPVS